MEAHESALRALALTADGSKLATASIKGTVIRVWDVATGNCLMEFRRGVERANITCLAFSWDYAWLSCTSDKGTAHVFQVDNKKEEKKKSGESSSFTQMVYSSLRRSVEGDAKKSVFQIRGVPHPQACAFVAEASNLLAVAGWDADGNGVLLLSEFAVAGEEPRRVGYHVLCKTTIQDESEEARRRRRLRGWTPEIPQTPEGGRLYVGERLEILEKGMEQIRFEETDEFVSVTAVQPKEQQEETGEASAANQKEDTSSQNTDEAPSNVDSGTAGGDSIRTEPLDGSETQ